ncbi:response regulator transcription factor [Roseicella sp. DB1501]|jgi:two-component system, cell cycle response regulator CtrA|uniref:response regulator transcription factor n=1 Tax=Roseicella sp. DB1501 TaxID=2730925 RepID=UPI001490FA55|nr:response regulator transcription factor [Roseicella sp. DB1501]NOG73264.1 response regulator transcription factor [Roseicella sp. DB1501]
MRIAVASDAAPTAELEAALGELGVLCDPAESMAELPSIVALSGPYDLVLLRIGRALRNALPAIRDLRRRGMNLPIIVYSATPAGAEEEEAVLHAGADDVIFHPFRLSVLHARMQALARRARGYTCAELVCGNVTLDQEQHAVTVDGLRVNLTAREFDFLETLMLHKGVLLTKERFMTRLYADSEAPDSKIVDVFVCKLRRKLTAAGAAEIIRTVWGRGYVVFEPTQAAIEAARKTRQSEIEPAPRGWVRRAPRFLAATA